MNRSEQIDVLAKSLAKAQLEMTAALKSSLNPHFKSKFAGLPEVAEVAKALNRNGLAYVQSTRTGADGVTIETVLLHESGQWVSGELTLRPQQDTPQGIGSAITYGRRYGLCSLVGIVADEDDDGNAASAKAPVKSNGNGSPKPQVKAEPTPEEKEAIRMEEACAAGFATVDAKLTWKSVNREIINGLPKELKQSVVAAFDKAAVRT